MEYCKECKKVAHSRASFCQTRYLLFLLHLLWSAGHSVLHWPDAKVWSIAGALPLIHLLHQISDHAKKKQNNKNDPHVFPHIEAECRPVCEDLLMRIFFNDASLSYPLSASNP